MLVEAARQAVQLDPDNVLALKARSSIYHYLGRFGESEQLAGPPAWHFHFVAIDLYLKADYDEMRRVAERAAVDDFGFSQFLLAIANGALSERRATQEALARLATFKTLAPDPAAYMRRHGATKEIVEPLLAGLARSRAVAYGS
jgi:hypothetical protein